MNMNNLETVDINELENIVEPIPLLERNIFQAKLMKKMFGEGFKDKPRQEKTNIELDWAKSYAKKVSDIIDHREYQYIRDLITSGQYEEAVELILPIITPNISIPKEAA